MLPYLVELTREERILGFVATSIETLSRRFNRPYIEVYAAMKESGALQYMVDCYEPLHTQSREYVDDSILEFIHNRNISI